MMTTRKGRRATLVSSLALIHLFASLLVVLLSAESSPSLTKPRRRRLVIGIDGGTESIRACCFDAENGAVVGRACAVPYPTYHPQPGWAEQDPCDWYENLGRAVRGAVASLDRARDDEVSAICVDTTCCSVVALGNNMEPLRRSLLWMDVRSAPQTTEIVEKCRGDPALAINCGGGGPVSAEWMTPKALWIRQNEPHVWKAATTICEYQDFINYKLTGIMCANSCNAATRWHWDGELSLTGKGRPLSMYNSLGIPELVDKLPQRCLPMGALIGRLTPEAALHLDLPIGVAVAQGGPDAFVGMIGLGCIYPGQLCLITGSSHLHCVVTSKPTTAAGIWGAYRGAPIPGMNFAEGGQSSTGSILRWAKALFGDDYIDLDKEASSVPAGCEGLIALETFQGSRTPHTDPLARGALIGLTLSHTRGHIWRAFMEAVCFGTRACVEGLASAGHDCDEIIIAGGSTRSPLWLQMHSDVTGKPVVVCENTDAPILGCAILASVVSDVHESVQSAVEAMVRTTTRIVPNPGVTRVYDAIFENGYKKIGPAVRPVSHFMSSREAQANLCSMAQSERTHSVGQTRSMRGGDYEMTKTSELSANTKNFSVSPSLLASDWSRVHEEVARCVDAGADNLHIDIFDGVFIDSPHALTFGPQMVRAIRRCCNDLQSPVVLDLHICVDRPARYVQAMADAGANRFIFQWEAIQGTDNEKRLESAQRLVENVVATGMKCGVSINPQTPVSEIFPLLGRSAVDLIDVLAVEPGFGGQTFKKCTLDKVKSIADWRLAKGRPNTSLLIMVDGGVNSQTAESIVQAGADVLVSGSFLFDHPESLKRGIDELYWSLVGLDR